MIHDVAIALSWAAILALFGMLIVTVIATYKAIKEDAEREDG